MSTAASRIIPLPLHREIHEGDTGFNLADARIISGIAEEAAATLLAAALDIPFAEDSEYATVTLHIDGTGAPESSRIEVWSEGIHVLAADAAGLFYAVQTLRQLPGEDGLIPAQTIEDSPRFAYRGAMLDVARHFFDVATVRAVIDRLALLKLNHLHLHLTDDQGWRLEIASRPRLTEVASGTAVGGGPGGFYTGADYREIVEYAARNHIVIVPEIDIPGHTNAALLAYPELADAGVLVENYTGTEVGFSSLAINSEASYDFLRDVLAEVAALTPGPYLHIGGDEALKTEPEDFLTFIARAGRIAADTGKTVLGWHEMGRSSDLPRGSIGQYWSLTTPRENAAAEILSFVNQGGSAILSPADRIYLDIKHTAADPLGLVWPGGPVSARQSYEWEPSELVAGLDEPSILGIEAPLWTETVATLADIDAMYFPRLLGVAETAWSPRAGETRPERSWESFAPAVAAWFERVGIPAGISFTRDAGIEWAGEHGRTLPAA